MVDASAIGREFAPTHARVEPGRLRFFFNTLGEANPVYRDPAAAKAAGFVATPIPPTYLFCLEMMDADDPFEMLEALDIDLRRVLHGEQRFVYHAPVVGGDELTMQSTVTGVTQKKGGAMTLIDVTTRIVNQRGQHVADAIRVVVVRNPKRPPPAATPSPCAISVFSMKTARACRKATRRRGNGSKRPPPPAM